MAADGQLGESIERSRGTVSSNDLSCLSASSLGLCVSPLTTKKKKATLTK